MKCRKLILEFVTGESPAIIKNRINLKSGLYFKMFGEFSFSQLLTQDAKNGLIVLNLIFPLITFTDDAH